MQVFRRVGVSSLALGALCASLLGSSGCAGDDDDDDVGAGRAGAGGSSGKGGAAGKGGSSSKGGSSGKGGAAGNGGSSGKGGFSGEGGAAGSEENGGSGAGGEAGTPAGAGASGEGGAGASGAGGASGEGGLGGEGGSPSLPDSIGPLPYLSLADSPFTGLDFDGYFYVEDWEDGTLDIPGVTPNSTSLASSVGAGFVDSVDGDDGTIDGDCVKAPYCDSLFSSTGTLEFVFDATALGGLPTHVGAVWTDGSLACNAIFAAYDTDGILIDTITATAIGDADNTGATSEDRFFGVVHNAGVERITIQSSSGGVEVDHLQIGR
jgi:hypothetical protein